MSAKVAITMIRRADHGVDRETTSVHAFAVDDPSLYAQTVAWRERLEPALIDRKPLEGVCHEGNYALANILKGADVGETFGGSRDQGAGDKLTFSSTLIRRQPFRADWAWELRHDRTPSLPDRARRGPTMSGLFRAGALVLTMALAAPALAQKAPAPLPAAAFAWLTGIPIFPGRLGQQMADAGREDRAGQ